MHVRSIGSAAQHREGPLGKCSSAGFVEGAGRRATCLRDERGRCQRADGRRPARHGRERGLDPTSWVSKIPTSWEVGTASSALAVLGGAPSTLAGGQARARN
jgi:hypothetical protein